MYTHFEMVVHTPEMDYCGAELDFTQICEASQAQNMKPLDIEKINSHSLGVATLAWSLSHCGVESKGVVAYAGITGFEEHDNTKFAVIGGFITLAEYQGQGLGTESLSTIDDIASCEAMATKYNHEGLMARCNGQSKDIFKEQGYEVLYRYAGQYLMMKLL